MSQQRFEFRRFIHTGPFAGLIALIHLTLLLLIAARAREKQRIVLFVGVYAAALIVQAFAVYTLYLAIRDYLEPQASWFAVIRDQLSWTDFSPLSFLTLFITPSFALMFASSLLLGKARVGIAHLVLALRDSQLERLEPVTIFLTASDKETHIRQLDGVFGAMRALLFNSFAFIQYVVATFVIGLLEPTLAAISILSSLGFFLFLSKMKQQKKKISPIQQIQEHDKNLDDVELEGDLGVNPKSFERLERMRILGRNWGYFVIATGIVLGIGLNLDFMESLDTFTICVVLLRLSLVVYVPLGVIASAIMPYKKKLMFILNINGILQKYGVRDEMLRKSARPTVILTNSHQTNEIHLATPTLLDQLQKSCKIASFDTIQLNSNINKMPLGNKTLNRLTRQIKAMKNDGFFVFWVQ